MLTNDYNENRALKSVVKPDFKEYVPTFHPLFIPRDKVKPPVFTMPAWVKKKT
jgi:hypothetical protein